MCLVWGVNENSFTFVPIVIGIPGTLTQPTYSNSMVKILLGTKTMWKWFMLLLPHPPQWIVWVLSMSTVHASHCGMWYVTSSFRQFLRSPKSRCTKLLPHFLLTVLHLIQSYFYIWNIVFNVAADFSSSVVLSCPFPPVFSRTTIHQMCVSCQNKKDF